MERTLKYISLDNLEATCRGDRTRMRKYLDQFLDLIPQRVEELTGALKKDQRVLVRKILHKMSPQLEFFGIQDTMIPIRRLEFEYETMLYNDLEMLVNGIIYKLDGALSDIERVIQTDFEN